MFGILYRLTTAICVVAICLLECGVAYASEASKPTIHVQKALQAVFEYKKFQSPHENVTDLKAVLVTGAELSVGSRGFGPPPFVRDRMYWKVEMQISATPTYAAYRFTAFVDAESGTVLDKE